MFPLLYPPNVMYTVLASVGSMVMRVTILFGNTVGPLFTLSHFGVGESALLVLNRSPLLCPTHTIFDSPLATAIALINSGAGSFSGSHEGHGSLVLGVLASFVTQREAPPTSIRLELLGSRTKGAMKFALPALASGIKYGGLFHTTRWFFASHH